MGAAGLRLRAAAVAAVAVAALAGAPVTAHADEVRPVVGGEALGSKTTVVGEGAPKPPKVSAAAWLVADLDTGEVLGARNAHGRFLPASTMKTLTAVALLPGLDLNKTYRPTFDEVNIEGSKVGLMQGKRYPVGKLVEAMLVVSGNDAAAALASAAGGYQQSIDRMNATARRLQAFDTTAKNPSGLDAPGQYTSAYDLALIAREGLKNPQFVKYSTTLRSHMPAPGGKKFEIYNHNKLLTDYRGGIGVKTGYTLKARHTYVGAARRGGHTIGVTLLKAETMYPDAKALLDWGFKTRGNAVPIGRLVDPVPEPGAEVRADRSRPLAGAAVAAPPVATPAAARSFPVVPAAGGAAVVTTLAALRTRARRRRNAYRTSGPKLKLPVR
jgi:D-alanyl-D-alanine carboxypeptidase (penicillin-binding protein 5/6)